MYFVPTASKHRGEVCGGVHLHVTDGRRIRPVELGFRLVELARTAFPGTFSVLPPQTAGGTCFLSLLAGRRDLEEPDWSADTLLRDQAADCAAFREQAEQYRLY